MTLRRPHLDLNEACPIRDVLDRLGDRWTVLILHELSNGTLRFGALRQRIEDISPRMLSQTLRQLEWNGLVLREVYPTIPPRVDYSLTPLGESFFAAVQVLVQWAEANQETVHAARRAYVPPQTNTPK